MDFFKFETLVTKYLDDQGWQIVDVPPLAQEIWQTLDGQNPSAQEATKFIGTQITLRYAVRLYEVCRQPTHPHFPRAWEELKTWLTKNAPLFTADPTEQDELVQETLIELHHRLPSDPLNAPRALWAYLLQIMRNKRTDHHRRATAVKRGDDTLLSVEELNENHAEGPTTWEETQGPQTDPRDTENQVTAQDVRIRLQTLFQTHLRSDMQIQVAEAHFLDGLSPQEIAELLGKRPHEIRMIKARIVQTLRELPPSVHQELLEILDIAADASFLKGEKETRNE